MSVLPIRDLHINYWDKDRRMAPQPYQPLRLDLARQWTKHLPYVKDLRFPDLILLDRGSGSWNEVSILDQLNHEPISIRFFPALIAASGGGAITFNSVINPSQTG